MFEAEAYLLFYVRMPSKKPTQTIPAEKKVNVILIQNILIHALKFDGPSLPYKLSC